MSPGGILPTLLHSLWTAFRTITGIAGLTPQQLGMVLAGIIGLLLAFTIAQTVKSRRAFSLDPRDSEWNV